MTTLFIVNAVYTKSNFINTFKEIKGTVPSENTRLHEIISKNIAWAEAHDDGTIFEWTIEPDGSITPHAISSTQIPIETTPDSDTAQQ